MGVLVRQPGILAADGLNALQVLVVLGLGTTARLAESVCCEAGHPTTIYPYFSTRSRSTSDHIEHPLLSTPTVRAGLSARKIALWITAAQADKGHSGENYVKWSE
jgi:hypothetical protein